MIRVLVVDDEEPFRRLLDRELKRKGFYVETSPDGETALALLKNNAYDVVLLDVVMPGIDGISFMKKISKDSAMPSIVVLTGRATVETAVDAMKHGAYDYLSKPYKLDELVIIIHRAFEYRQLKIKNRLLEQELARKESMPEFVGRSRPFMELLALIKKIAPTDSSVFVQGESGTGKEMVANAIWHYSRRNHGPFTALNCATFSENLMESELFGHEKGAFTSAYQTKYGIVEVADKGTLFLDEIGDMPLNLQSKLLRFLDSGEFRRVGGNKNLKVDVRVIAATNKDLTEAVESGAFRQDLFYRLNVINLTMPALRERKEDVPELSKFFMSKYGKKMSKDITGMTAAAAAALNSYDWPGNVRELENVIERAVILCDSSVIGLEDLSISGTGKSKKEKPYLSLEEMERDHILKVLKDTGGNQSKASQILGIDRKTLYLKLKKYGIEQA
ncbi:MAG: sigma-54-dependent Fis family transcriptional regulator [Nitrospirae bacterium]|nr:MAG: sigma-54-dependent Fis family transcriptional regulator [Nitrospirota bacterium]